MNMIVQEMARAMFDESEVPKSFWLEDVQTIVNILNKTHIRLNNDKTPYEDSLGKFDSRANEGTFL
jgi:hypothetical protein